MIGHRYEGIHFGVFYADARFQAGAISMVHQGKTKKKRKRCFLYIDADVLKALLDLTPHEHVDFGDLNDTLSELEALNHKLKPTRNAAEKLAKIEAIQYAMKGTPTVCTTNITITTIPP